MFPDIFNSTPNWSYSAEDEAAQIKLGQIQQDTIKNLPKNYYTEIYKHFDYIRSTKLFPHLQTLPKGVMHHLHYDCAEDFDFYREHIITDPIIYLTKEFDGFKLGTKEDAEKNGWVSMPQARKKFNSEEEFVATVANLTMLNSKECGEMINDQANAWDIFEKKIANFFPLQWSCHIFRKYTQHVFRKYIKNGYDRIEFRTLLVKLNQYDSKGNLIKQWDQSKFIQLTDQAFEVVKKDHPQFSVGYVFFGLKFIPAEENQKILTTVCEHKWDKTIGVDFVQQEDPNGSLKPYDQLADKVLAKYPERKLKKVYHCGETKDHTNKNIEIALDGGTARIGHGINILQHPHLIERCVGKVCFEKNPISNLLLSYVKDPRNGTAPILLGFGVPVSINPDDPGKFGCIDNTEDYFVSFVSFNWTLKHLKLCAIHSINHAICSEEEKEAIVKSFNAKWNTWVKDFLAIQN